MNRKRREREDASGNIVIALLAVFLSVAAISIGIASFWYYQNYLSVTAFVFAALAEISTSFINISAINDTRKSASNDIAYWALLLGSIGLAIATASMCIFFRPTDPKVYADILPSLF